MSGRTSHIDKTIAVVLAGGVGVRMGLGIPKQFVPIAGRTSLEHTVAIFEECDRIDEIIVMIEAASLATAENLLPAHRFPKVSQILPGGATRNATSHLALLAIDAPGAKVLFHDAVRPLVDATIIDACVDALDSYDAVDTAIPSADTIIEVDENDLIRSIPPRDSLRRGQTPQAFRWDTLMEAYSLAFADPSFVATDDCSVVLRYMPHVPILVVPGHEANIKLTHPIDVHLADKLFQLKHQTMSPADELSTSLDGAVVVVFGGSSGIGASVCSLLNELGATVVSLSRTETGTFVQDRESVRDALAQAQLSFGRIDHVVLAAGVLTVSPVLGLTDEQLQSDLGVNLVAAFIVAQEAHPYLERSRGSLLLYSSSSATRGRSEYGLYSATKAAIVNLSQTLADEWSEDGIRVNCVSPSRTATPMRTRAFGEEDADTLVPASAVAATSVQVLASTATGQTFDVRLARIDPLTPVGASR